MIYRSIDLSVLMKTTSTAANLRQSVIRPQFRKMTYAAEIAKISARLARVNPIRQIDSRTLNAAMIPSRADVDWTWYSTAMDEIGMRDARMPVSQYVIRYMVLSS